MAKSGFAFALLGLVGVASAAESSLEGWIDLQTSRSYQRVYQAISPSDGARGSVIASPSRSEPDYYYHWIRDAALVMREVWLYRSLEPSRAVRTLKDYALFSRKNQETPNRSGWSGVGEPKFYVDGSAYNEDWGRPQNDGPALRVLTLLGLAEELVLAGETDFVSRVLYRSELPARSVIKMDLEFIAHHWSDPSYDLWEEVKGDHFYTRICQWRALHEGALFAKWMGDADAAAFYAEKSREVFESLDKFWSSSRGYLLATRNRVEGASDKSSNLDIAVVLGVLHAGRKGFPFYVDDDRVLSTLNELILAFDYAYSINRDRTNDEGMKMAPGIGRYPEDRYTGTRTDGQGNPWFLTTHAVAEALLRLRGVLVEMGEVKITPVSRPFYESLVRADLSTSRSFASGDPTYEAILQALKDKSDAFIRRSKFHTGTDGHQSEQFHRNHGLMQGARDLTWSYASFLSLVRIRDHYYE